MKTYQGMVDVKSESIVMYLGPLQLQNGRIKFECIIDWDIDDSVWCCDAEAILEPSRVYQTRVVKPTRVIGRESPGFSSCKFRFELQSEESTMLTVHGAIIYSAAWKQTGGEIGFSGDLREVVTTGHRADQEPMSRRESLTWWGRVRRMFPELNRPFIEDALISGVRGEASRPRQIV